MIYGTYYVRYFEGAHRVEKQFSTLNEAESFWENCDDPTTVVLDENHAFVEYEELLRAV